MNFVNTLGVGRWIEDFQRHIRDNWTGNSDPEEPTVGDLWEKASPELEKALAIYNRRELPDTLVSSWIPGRTTKASCQRDLDAILDTVLAVLGTCGAAGYRQSLRDLQADNSTAQSRIVQYKEQMLSAPTETPQDFVGGLLAPRSKEALKDSIADEEDRIAERNQQIESMKEGFREHLKHIGLSVSPGEAYTFLLPVEDNIVAAAAVITNIGRITEQLQQLVDASKEAPEETKRYYGIYVLLVFAVERIQTHFVGEIDNRFLPKIDSYEKEAAAYIVDAQEQHSGGGPKEQLAASVAANRRNIDACRLMRDTLIAQRRSVCDEIRNVQRLRDAAVNSYRTVCLSFNVAALMGYCEAAFRALQELRLPPLRPFQNTQLSEEMQRLAERMVDKG